MTNTGRRARNRAARHQQLIDAAGAILAEEGLSNLTMQGVADRVDCAVGTIYTYFASKSALLAALQSNAIRVLADSHEAAATGWDNALDTAGTAERPAALARMLGLARLFVTWPELHPREFDFLQMLITSREEVITVEDALAVVPQALMLLSEGRVLIDAAAEVQAIRFDPDRPGDDSLSRTLRWVSGLDGSVLVAAAGALATTIDPDAFDSHRLAERLTLDLLVAWGANSEDILEANVAIDTMEAAGTLLPAAQP